VDAGVSACFGSERMTVGWGTAAFAQMSQDKCWYGQLQTYLSCLPPSMPRGYGH